MSDTDSGGSTGSKSTTPARSETKAKAKTETKAEAKSEAKSETKTETTSGTKTETTSEKSARDSVGGKVEVHYGYFSNVKNPAYRSGWDGIWGKGDKKNARPKPATKRAATAKKTAAPVTLDLDFSDLPDEIRDGLAGVARARLKKSRANYDKLDRAGSVTWRIECRVVR